MNRKIYAAFWITVATCMASQPLTADEISYRISIEPTKDRTNLHVAMGFVGNESGSTRLQLPEDRYGTPNIWQALSKLTASGAEIRPVKEHASIRELVHAPSAKVTVNYTMSWDPSSNTGEAYRPSVSETHFHFFGPQWRCYLPDSTGVQTFAISFENVPSGWTVFSNFGHGPGPYRIQSADDELSGFIAGGDYRSKLFKIDGRPVGAYVRPPFKNPESIVAGIRDIIVRQGELFGGFDREFFVVSLSPRPRISAGVAIDNAFVMFASPEKPRLDLDTLIAHEALHNWIGQTASLVGWDNSYSVDHFRFDWFMEGFTEYMARRMLLDAGRYRMKDFVDRFNKDLREQAGNSMRSATLDDIAKAYKSESFYSRHERTSYFRGPLIALTWDTQLRKRGEHTLYDLVRRFIEEASADDGSLSEEAFFRLIASFGLDGRSAYSRHIVDGVPPVPPPDAFGAGFVYRSGRTDFGAGFDIEASREDGVIRNVDRDGPAYSAGLRNRMAVVDLPADPAAGQQVKIKVRKDGKEMVFDYARAPVKPAPDRYEQLSSN